MPNSSHNSEGTFHFLIPSSGKNKSLAVGNKIKENNFQINKRVVNVIQI